MLKLDTTVHKQKTDAPTDTSCVSSFAPWKVFVICSMNMPMLKLISWGKDIEMDLFNKTGIAWNEDLAQDSDIEAEESEDMEVENSS